MISTIFVVILHDMYLRTVKVRSSSGSVNEYVRVVEAYRDNGKVKQRTLADLGRKDLLVEILPKLQRLLGGDRADTAEAEDLDILDASTWGPVLAVRALFDQLGLWTILDAALGKAKGVPFADRAFVLVANRLIRPASEHGLAGWLETDFVCDRQGRRFVPHWHQHKRVRVHFQQLEAWYRTLDQLVAAKEKIEVALYHRLRDLFSFKPDLVLYDITSTYFEGAGPAGFAKHGHSRDGKPHNVQVIVAVVMVAGWPIAHHVWAGNEVDHTTVGKAIDDLHQRFGFKRLVFVGDRGMVTNDNLEAITAGESWLSGGPEAAAEQEAGPVAGGRRRDQVDRLPGGNHGAGEDQSAAHASTGSPVGNRGHAGDHRRFRRAPRLRGGHASEVDGADAPGVGEARSSVWRPES